MDKNSLSHTSWKCQYHIVFIPKYRRQALYGQVKADIRDTGVYISANVSPARAVYRAEWGCPASGEPVFELRGVRNPMFCEKAPYFDALRMLTERLKAALKQSTAYLEYDPTRFDYYLNP